MIGIALEGGAERSSFTAGVIDALMARNFYAAAASGTSAGAGCVLNYRSRQQGVSLEMMIMERHSRYFGIRHMAHTGRFLNLDHMAQEYASRIDWTVYQQFAMQTDFVATCCEDGEPAVSMHVPQTTPVCVLCCGSCTPRNIPCCTTPFSTESPAMKNRYRL